MHERNARPHPVYWELPPSGTGPFLINRSGIQERETPTAIASCTGNRSCHPQQEGIPLSNFPQPGLLGSIDTGLVGFLGYGYCSPPSWSLGNNAAPLARLLGPWGVLANTIYALPLIEAVPTLHGSQDGHRFIGPSPAGVKLSNFREHCKCLASAISKSRVL